jgi:hypothetical protein
MDDYRRVIRGEIVRGRITNLGLYGILKESNVHSCYQKRTPQGELDHEARILKETERVQRELLELESRKFIS